MLHVLTFRRAKIQEIWLGLMITKGKKAPRQTAGGYVPTSTNEDHG
jgi:hypothetical protein